VLGGKNRVPVPRRLLTVIFRPSRRQSFLDEIAGMLPDFISAYLKIIFPVLFIKLYTKPEFRFSQPGFSIKPFVCFHIIF